MTAYEMLPKTGGMNKRERVTLFLPERLKGYLWTYSQELKHVWICLEIVKQSINQSYNFIYPLGAIFNCLK